LDLAALVASCDATDGWLAAFTVRGSCLYWRLGRV